jgi:hypothetical protein
VVGPDGWIYFGVGSATNSGVVGPDNAQFGWLKRFPDAHDIPPYDIVLSGQNFISNDALNPGSGEKVTTGAYVPYGTPTCPGQIIKGQLPCTGAILRIPPSGGKPELVAWGFRDYWGSVPLTHPQFAENKTEPRPQFLLVQHPNVPPEPAARLGVRSSSDGFDFSRNPDFGHVGEAFIAVFGDMTGPSNGKVRGGLGPAMLLFPGPLVRTQVRLGLGPMPSFRRDEVSAAELNDLIAYVKAARGSAHPFLLHD